MKSTQECYRVRVEAFFEAAHNLRSYKGSPEPLHGHSWKVEVEVEADRLDQEGMAIDFVELQSVVQALTKKLDYTYINDVPPFTDIAPSAENIAKWYAEELRSFAANNRCRVVEVRVWEGRHASAAYRD
ncbi:MAG TPA: 6-carboxytetrahydropterin synthase [Bdellovibrionota bacterium]|nr:6-carboxytetrahydropterin synthase [Bdellovibrionota bacterium]